MWFNEIDPFAAQWLRNLFPGAEVDERSIRDLAATDVLGRRRCHFFAGIAGWELALRWAGWPDDREVWTGSCPCQPFSAAGKRKGQADERHLWPDWFRLIRECRPATVFGEQVASADVVGTEPEAAFLIAVQAGEHARANKLAKRLVAQRSFHFAPRWLTRIRADLEGEGYAVWWAVLGAHSAGSPHIRQRLYWVANLPSEGRRWQGSAGGTSGRRADESGRLRDAGELGFSNGNGRQTRKSAGEANGYRSSARPDGSDARGLADPDGRGFEQSNASIQTGSATASNWLNPWSDFEIVWCDERRFGRGWVPRRAQRGIFPMAHGIPGRVGLLRAYGNAIVPQVAAVFVRAFLESEGGA